MLRVDTERRFLPRFENRGLALSNVSITQLSTPALLLNERPNFLLPFIKGGGEGFQRFNSKKEIFMKRTAKAGESLIESSSSNLF
jgi:hypothetical protein